MTKWSELVAYKCDHCSTDCINHIDSDRVDLGLCVDCLDELPESLLSRARQTPGPFKIPDARQSRGDAR
jgi:hypothetical protein